LGPYLEVSHLFSKNIKDVIVIGAGPAGSMAARTAASAGMKVAMFDPGPIEGRRSQCGEVISRRAIGYSGLDNLHGVIVHEMEYYRIISPSGGTLAARSPALSIDKSRFEMELIKRCEDLGVEMHPLEAVRDAGHGNDLWTVSTIKGLYKARSVILACGPHSPLMERFGLGSNSDMMIGFGARIPEEARTTNMDFFVSADMAGGYAWRFPRGDEINIGVCARGEVQIFFNRLLRRLGVKRERISSYFGGLIPDGGPIDHLVGSSCIAAGDAGGFCHPVSKGGVHCSMISGVEASKAMISHLSGDAQALARFDSSIREHPAFSSQNLQRRDLLSSLPDDILDTLTSITKGRDIFLIGKRGLVLQSMKHPNLLPYASKATTLFYGGMGWLDFTF
jgi:flavin-dependent dehydrogenase